MKKGTRCIVGEKHAYRLYYKSLVGKEVEIDVPYQNEKDTWYVYVIQKSGRKSRDRWYIHKDDLITMDNQGTLRKLKGEIEI